MECLENIIGLTTSDCDCYDDYFDEEDYESRSGLYLDDLKNGIPLIYPANALDCDQSNLKTIMTRAISDGITDFKVAFTQEVAKMAKNAVRDGGIIGDSKNNNTITNGGIRITPAHIRGAYLELSGITLHNGGNVVITKNGSEIFNETYADTSGWHTNQLSDIVKMPFIENGFVNEYEITLSGTAVNNKLDCGCRRGRKWYSKYMKVEGYPKSKEAYGMRLHMELECDGTEWLCGLKNFNDDISLAVAKAVQLFAINNLISFVLNSGRINSYTTLEQDRLYARINGNMKIVGGLMEYISKNSRSDCYRCNERVTKSSIIV